MKYGDWRTKEAELYVLGRKQTGTRQLGADVMSQLGLTLNQNPVDATMNAKSSEKDSHSTYMKDKMETRIKQWAQNKEIQQPGGANENCVTL